MIYLKESKHQKHIKNRLENCSFFYFCFVFTYEILVRQAFNFYFVGALHDVVPEFAEWEIRSSESNIFCRQACMG